MKIIFCFTLFLVYTFAVSAQQTDTIISPVSLSIFEELEQNRMHNGYVNIKSAQEITDLINLHAAINKEHNRITGFRIQIFSGSSYDHSIEKLQTIKENFEKDFPDIPAYLNYFDPDFKIRVGNFRNRLECIPLLKKIRRKYPSCYPVKTEIPLNDLNKLSQKNNQTSPESEENIQ